MEIKKGMLFKSNDSNYKTYLEILEVLPNRLYKCSYDPDFEENSFYITEEELFEDFTLVQKG